VAGGSRVSGQLGTGRCCLKKENRGPTLVVHTCNPRYSGGQDQEDSGSKPAPHKYFMKPYVEKIHHKKELMEWLKWP
jgi:hypothetical protein